MKVKAISYVIFSLVFVLAIIYLGSIIFQESGEKINGAVQEQIIKDSLPAGDIRNLKTEHNSPDTALISVPPKTKSNDKIKKENALTEKSEPEVKLIAYYFHPTARCHTCLNIENFTKEVIQTKFEKEVKNGTITFLALNIEDSLNEHYINDYNLRFSSLILAKLENNKRVKWKNLEHVWKFANDKEQFFKYASIEIKSYFKEKE
jgi:hypothetical protein